MIHFSGGSREFTPRKLAVITALQLEGLQPPPKVKLRPLFWDKVPVPTVATSVWGKMGTTDIVPEPQLRVLERLFPQAAPVVAKKKHSDSSGESMACP